MSPSRRWLDRARQAQPGEIAGLGFLSIESEIDGLQAALIAPARSPDLPGLTVSIGVVTNERRTFTHAAQVSALATEMKSYAKTLPGSVFSIDRRTDTLSPGELADVGLTAALTTTGRGGGTGGRGGGGELK